MKLIAPEGLTDKDTWHSYLQTYESLFNPIRETVKTVVEIGVDGGGSLIMWENFFPNATIIGVDLNKKPPAIEGHPRIVHQQMNAYIPNISILTADIIIDDGSHFLQDQTFFVKYYSKLLKPGGLLIVEDIQKMEHIAILAAALPEGFNHTVVDLRHVKLRYDDVLFVASKI